MDPISGVETIPKTRWRLKCSICKIHRGAPIQCAKTQCFTAFHVTCARRDKLLMPMKSSDGSDGTLEAFCDKHLPPAQREIHEAALAAREAEDTGSGLRTTKAARAYAKTYTTGPPLVPALIVRRIVEYITSLSVRKKEAFVQLVARYWSLKREARRGAPLLKRLHLEPWTAIAGRAEASMEDRQLKLEALQQLRQNLAAARELTDSVCSREAVKLQQAQIISDAISRTLYPFHAVLKMIVGKLMGHDKNGYFKHPVSKEVAPDYEERIKQPMWWQLIEDKLEAHAYWDTATFSSDILLIVNNAMEYNKPDTPIYKTAARIKTHAETHLAELGKYTTQHPVSETPSVDQLFDAPIFAIGDLEPPQGIVDLLDSEELLTSELDIILNKAPAAALLAYELPNLKPPPPPPPRRVRRARPPKRDYVKERARAADRRALAEHDDPELRQLQAIAQELDAQDALDVSPGFRSRTTRRKAGNASASAGPSSITPATPVVETPRGRSSTRKTRQEAPPVVERSAVPLLVEDVGNHQSFLSFNTGWILAEGSRRRRAATTPSGEGSAPIRVPPRKRQRLAAPAASVASAVASTSSKVHSGTSPPSSSSRNSSPLSELSVGSDDDGGDMEVDEGKALDTSVEAAEEPPVEIMPEPEPEPAPVAEQSEPMDESPSSRKSLVDEHQPPIHVHGEELSIVSPAVPERSEGSGMPVEGDTSRKKAIIIEVIDTPETRRAQAMARKKAKLEAMAAEGSNGAAASDVAHTFIAGDLVWAKSTGFPWWPAEVREYRLGDESIPRQIHDVMKTNNASPKETRQDLYAVYYYEENNWDCVAAKQLKSLGDDAVADEKVLKTNKYKNSSLRSRCRTAYQQALAAMLSPEATSEAQHDNAEIVPEQ